MAVREAGVVEEDYLQRYSAPVIALCCRDDLYMRSWVGREGWLARYGYRTGCGCWAVRGCTTEPA